MSHDTHIITSHIACKCWTPHTYETRQHVELCHIEKCYTTDKMKQSSAHSALRQTHMNKSFMNES